MILFTESMSINFVPMMGRKKVKSGFIFPFCMSKDWYTPPSKTEEILC